MDMRNHGPRIVVVDDNTVISIAIMKTQIATQNVTSFGPVLQGLVGDHNKFECLNLWEPS